MVILCHECRAIYEDTNGRAPVCCGACGSRNIREVHADWVEAKVILERELAMSGQNVDELRSWLRVLTLDAPQTTGTRRRVTAPVGRTEVTDVLDDVLYSNIKKALGLHERLELSYVVDGFMIEFSDMDGSRVLFQQTDESILVLVAALDRWCKSYQRALPASREG